MAENRNSRQDNVILNDDSLRKHTGLGLISSRPPMN